MLFLYSQSQARSSNCNYNDFTTDGSSDPYLSSQWYYSNSGEDLNPSSVWNSNRGERVRVAVVDDGLDIYHEDLTSNVVPGGSYNFGVGYYGFSTSLSDPFSVVATHGTAVGGVIGARDKNGLGIAGIAPRSCLVGYNVLVNSTDANTYTAMTYNASDVSVSNNSWGATDGNGKTAANSSLWASGVDLGVTTGRNGKGTVYFWAAGNGANTNNATAASGVSAYPAGSLETDNSNYDGQANYYGVAAVCALTDDGKRVNYSEKGANLWVCGYAQKTNYSTTQDGIWTTDITGYDGYNPLPSDYLASGYSQSKQLSNYNYSKIFNGTSGATPMATATAALLVNANPNLGWRDVKLILAESARKNDPTDSDWLTNAGSKISSSGTPYNINHKYGFGVIDINRAVTLAKTWTNVGTMLQYATSTITANASFSNNTTLAAGASSSVNITSSNTSITKIEFIEITVTTASADASDLEIALTSPQGTSSTLAEAHICSVGSNTYPSSTSQVGACGNYSGWVFGTSRHLGETPIGTWTLRVADRRSGTGSSSGWGNGGTLTSWKIKFYGRAN
ncbi:MAG TPA: S8 family serine peptidase [Leptospiraceae bacterium]|nr:S8 family serine peptidase [Leptospiraceae bacterium]